MKDTGRSPAVEVSIIICCHDGRSRLERTLERLARQRVPGGFSWEIILVDNASTDGTAEFARDFWMRCGAPTLLRVHHEMRLGLTYARLAGFELARGEVVSFVDDDNWVNSDWCRRLRDDFARDALIGVVGARGQAVFEGGKQPPWFDRYLSGYAVGPQRHAPQYFYGAGLSLRRQALADLIERGFRPALHGRIGQRLSAGDDAELCLALSIAGWKLYYDPELMFEHFLPQKRLLESYLHQLYYGFGYSSALQDIYLGFCSARSFRGRLSCSFAIRYTVALSKASLFAICVRIPNPWLHRKRLSARVARSYASGRARGLIETRARARTLRSEISGWLAARGMNRAAGKDRCNACVPVPAPTSRIVAGTN